MKQVKINENMASYVFEMMQLSNPLCNFFILPFLKWPLETILRLYLSCSLGRKMILYIVHLMDEKDCSFWKSIIVGDFGDVDEQLKLKAENAPTILNDISEDNQKEMNFGLSRLRLSQE